MIDIRLKDSGASLGTIGEADLRIVIDQFEEESSTDRDYFIDSSTLGLLEDAGISPDFAAMLRTAIGSSDGIDIVWSKA